MLRRQDEASGYVQSKQKTTLANKKVKVESRILVIVPPRFKL